MEPEGSLPYSQVPATCPYPEPTPSSTHNPSNVLKIHLNILHLCLGLPNGFFPSGFPTNTLCTALSSSIRATYPAHLISILPPAQYWVRNTDHSPPHYVTFSIPVTSSLLGPNTHLNTLFPNTLSVSDQVSHLYKTTGKIIVLYILITYRLLVWKTAVGRVVNGIAVYFNILAPEFGSKILAHPVCKMRIIQEPKKVAL
jgi:hypothetical protein